VTNPYAPPAAEVADVAVVPGHIERASRLSRLGAVILDSIVGGLLVYVPMMIGFVIAGSPFTVSSPQTVEANPQMFLIPLGLAAIGAMVWAGLTIWYVLANGQTIGKKIVGIKVVRADGTRASFPRILFLRNGINTLVGFIPFVGIAYAIVDALFIFREDERCIHDLLADTIVVQAQRPGA
jgi:uncharacterized RDD family membrane protein YckC